MDNRLVMALLATTALGGFMPSTLSAQTAPSPASPAASTEVEIVTVTAQRRAESVQDVPIAVTALSGLAIEQAQIVNFTDVPNVVPSLQYTGGSLPFFLIRGIGTNVFDPGTESSVGVLLDDVPQILPRTPFLNTLTDIGRVEVLRGPQGNLFGKNASAGVISIATGQVDLNGPSNRFRISYGTRGDLNASNTVNVPLSEAAGVRITLAYKERDGYIKNAFTGEDLYAREDFGVNAKLRYAAQRWDVQGILDFQRHRDNGHAIWTVRSLGTGIANTANIPGNFVSQALSQFGITPSPENRAGAWDGPTYNRTDSLGLTLQANYDAGPFTVTSVTGWRDLDYSIALDTDSTPQPFYSINSGLIGAEQLTQEIRLASNAKDGLQYVAGLFFARLEVDQDILQAGTFGLIPNNSPFRLGNLTPGIQRTAITSENVAAFGNVSVPVTSATRLNLGARYSEDKFDGSYRIIETPNICLRAVPGPAQAIAGNCITAPRPADSSGTLKNGDWSGRVGLQHDLNDRLMLYASASRGYKGPALVPVQNVLVSLRPETSDAYEIGMKAELFARRLVVNLAVFDTTYFDFQANTITVFQGTNINAAGNAGELNVRGVELETKFKLTPALDGSFNVAYNDSQFVDYLAPCYPGQTAAQGCQPAVAATPTSPAIPARFQAAGNPLTNAPEWTISGSLGYEREITAGRSLNASVNATYRSDVIFSVGNPDTTQEAYTIVNANLTYGATDDRWRVGLFARNLFDQNYVIQIAPNIGDNRGGTGFVVGYHNRPTEAAERTIGVNLEFNF